MAESDRSSRGWEQDTRVQVEDSAPASGVIRVELTRTELVALRETIELTPVFEGRDRTRDAIREVLAGREARPRPLCAEESSLAALARRILPIDVQASALRSKLYGALQRERFPAV
jgi:hypothetical protein